MDDESVVWLDVTVIGSAYEQQASRLEDLRDLFGSRSYYADLGWRDGPAPIENRPRDAARGR